jgi:hypothetical protein
MHRELEACVVAKYPVSQIKSIAGAFVLLSVLTLTGCGRGVPLYEVTGDASYVNGTALPESTIEFRSIGTSKLYIASGSLGKDGKFSLETEGLGKGLVPGDYQAVVIPRAHGGKHPVTMDDVPRKFREYPITPLKFQVTTDESKNHFHIAIDVPKRVVKVKR